MVGQGRKPPPAGPFAYWQLHFIQFPLYYGYEYVLTIIHVFPH